MPIFTYWLFFSIYIDQFAVYNWGFIIDAIELWVLGLLGSLLFD